MYRLFKKYSLPAGYAGIPVGLEHRSLDRIDGAGQVRVADIHRTGRNRGPLFRQFPSSSSWMRYYSPIYFWSA